MKNNSPNKMFSLYLRLFWSQSLPGDKKFQSVGDSCPRLVRFEALIFVDFVLVATKKIDWEFFVFVDFKEF